MSDISGMDFDGMGADEISRQIYASHEHVAEERRAYGEALSESEYEIAEREEVSVDTNRFPYYWDTKDIYRWHDLMLSMDNKLSSQDNLLLVNDAIKVFNGEIDLDSFKSLHPKYGYVNDLSELRELETERREQMFHRVCERPDLSWDSYIKNPDKDLFKLSMDFLAEKGIVYSPYFVATDLRSYLEKKAEGYLDIDDRGRSEYVMESLRDVTEFLISDDFSDVSLPVPVMERMRDLQVLPDSLSIPSVVSDNEIKLDTLKKHLDDMGYVCEINKERGRVELNCINTFDSGVFGKVENGRNYAANIVTSNLLGFASKYQSTVIRNGGRAYLYPGKANRESVVFMDTYGRSESIPSDASKEMRDAIKRSDKKNIKKAFESQLKSLLSEKDLKSDGNIFRAAKVARSFFGPGEKEVIDGYLRSVTKGNEKSMGIELRKILKEYFPSVQRDKEKPFGYER